MTDHNLARVLKSCLALAAALCCWVGQASAQSTTMGCEASLERSDQLVRFIYDPFEPDVSSQTLNVHIRNTGPKRCTLALTVAGDGARNRRLLQKGRARLEYEILQNGIVLLNERTLPRFAPPVIVEPNSELTVPLQFRIRAGDFTRAGEYSDELTLRLFQMGSGARQLVAPETPLIISAVVPARAQLNVAGSRTTSFGANPAGLIDFGELQTGKQRRVFVQVRSTSEILLRLSSAENGQMTHAIFNNAVRGVPYTVRFGGAQRSLSDNPIEIARPAIRRPAGRVINYPLTFEITDASERVAGIYKDVVTISVEPR